MVESTYFQGDDASIYVHIPFCKKKCSYCHFYVIPDHPEKQKNLFDSLLQEWNNYIPYYKDKKVVSIYFGGGTPILFELHYLDALLEHIRKSIRHDSDIEITMEANPEEVSAKKIKDLMSLGINRISVGVQTHDDNLLQLLGRQHKGSIALESVRTIADAGVTNISVDAMYDLPDQKIHLWESTLQAITKLPVTHVSLYNLTIEPQTLFFKNKKQLEPRLPDENESVAMYKYAHTYLQGCGFEHYEISAFAKPAHKAIHNSGYWIGRPFIGLGPSAFSYWDGKRFRNISHLEKYVKAIQQSNSPIDFEEKLSEEASLREYLAVRLRLLEGFELPQNLKENILKDIRSLEEKGWITNHNGKIALTEQGILFYDSVAVELI